jgi:hypothetical protein
MGKKKKNKKKMDDSEYALKNLNYQDKGKLLEKMVKEFDIAIYYCEFCNKVYDGSSCYFTGCNDLNGYFSETCISAFESMQKLNVNTKAKIIGKITRELSKHFYTEFSASIFHCKRCNGIFQSNYCLNMECNEESK